MLNYQRKPGYELNLFFLLLIIVIFNAQTVQARTSLDQPI